MNSGTKGATGKRKEDSLWIETSLLWGIIRGVGVSFFNHVAFLFFMGAGGGPHDKLLVLDQKILAWCKWFLERLKLQLGMVLKLNLVS